MSFYVRKGNREDAAGIGKVQVDSWNTTYRGLVADEFIDSLTYVGQTAKWSRLKDEAILYVLENLAGEVVGFASGGAQRRDQYPDYDGELYAIYLLQAYQGQGGGGLLFDNVKSSLQKNGFKTMLVQVLKGNPAVKFYEAKGGRLLGEDKLEIGDKTYVEYVYGWDLNH